MTLFHAKRFYLPPFCSCIDIAFRCKKKKTRKTWSSFALHTHRFYRWNPEVNYQRISVFRIYQSSMSLKIIHDVCVLCCFDWCVLGLRFSLSSFFKNLVFLAGNYGDISLGSFWNAYTVQDSMKMKSVADQQTFQVSHYLECQRSLFFSCGETSQSGLLAGKKMITSSTQSSIALMPDPNKTTCMRSRLFKNLIDADIIS